VNVFRRMMQRRRWTIAAEIDELEAVTAKRGADPAPPRVIVRLAPSVGE
jgi:hypothetical protein